MKPHRNVIPQRQTAAKPDQENTPQETGSAKPLPREPGLEKRIKLDRAVGRLRTGYLWIVQNQPL